MTRISAFYTCARKYIYPRLPNKTFVVSTFHHSCVCKENRVLAAAFTASDTERNWQGSQWRQGDLQALFLVVTFLSMVAQDVQTNASKSTDHRNGHANLGYSRDSCAGCGTLPSKSSRI